MLAHEGAILTEHQHALEGSSIAEFSFVVLLVLAERTQIPLESTKLNNIITFKHSSLLLFLLLPPFPS
jgi:hypothetical protein